MNFLNNGLSLTFVGHGTMLYSSPQGAKILVDPWLAGNPQCAPEFKSGVGKLDYILVTHGYTDHIGDLLTTARESQVPIVAMIELADWLEGKGIHTAVPMNKGGTTTLAGSGGIKVTLVHAEHSGGITDPETGETIYGGDPCGLVIRFENGYTVYHAGDTAVFGDMALIGEIYKPDLAVRPIGDHFTMGPLEAAHALRLIGVKAVVPIHYGTFPVLTGTPDQFKTLVGDSVKVLDLKPGEVLD